MTPSDCTTSTTDSAHSVSEPGSQSKAASLVEATKPGITKMVLLTTTVGFIIAAVSRPWQLADLIVIALGAFIGTALSSAGASALNEWWERDRDKLMTRTANRPLPQGILSHQSVLIMGISTSVFGVGILWVLCGLIPAMISLITILSYIFLYTPMKPVTSLATIVGAVPGALPPLIGWTAASTDLPDSGLFLWGGWSLFLLMFVWQIPHFLAIAWMYRDDYAAGGHKVLPVIDTTGHLTAGTMLLWAICLLPVSIFPVVTMGDRLGLISVITALFVSLGFIWLAYKLVRLKTRAAAKGVFFGSIIHLPVVLLAFVADALINLILASTSL